MPSQNQRDKLIEDNLALAQNAALKAARGAYIPRWITEEDISAIGAETLVKAADKFDPSRGLSFSSYMVWRVRNTVIDVSRRWGTMRREDFEVLGRVRTYAAEQGLPEDEAYPPGLSMEEVHGMRLRRAGGCVAGLDKVAETVCPMPAPDDALIAREEMDAAGLIDAERDALLDRLSGIFEGIIQKDAARSGANKLRKREGLPPRRNPRPRKPKKRRASVWAQTLRLLVKEWTK